MVGWVVRSIGQFLFILILFLLVSIQQTKRSSMTNDEVSTVYNALREYLIRNNFGWIVTQVDEEILRGKSLTKSIKEIGLNKMFLDAIENKKALAKEVVVSESYSISEQLGILIDGIEIGITDPCFSNIDMLIKH